MAQRIIDPEIEQRPKAEQQRKRDDNAHPIRELEIDRHHHHGEGAKHGEIALREIDHVGGPVDQYESQRYQRVDAAEADAGEQELEVEAHERPACCAAATTGVSRCPPTGILRRHFGVRTRLGRARIHRRKAEFRPPHSVGSIVEFNVLFEYHRAVVVLDDVVSVESITVGVKLVGPLRACISVNGEDRLCNLVGL
jgi:hypothetical protein